MGWHHRLWNLLRKGRLADEIDEELQFHLDASARAGVAAGLSEEDARREARARFGNPLVVREQTRDARIAMLADDLRQDVSFAIRTLSRRPAFAALALVTLAIGIGSTTAVFTVVRSVLLRPLPFPDPESLFVISHGRPGLGWLYPGMSDRGYLDFREANRTFEATATFAQAQSTLTDAGESVRLTGAAVTSDFFEVLGGHAAIGRTFGSQDDGPGDVRTVLVSDGLWRARFGSDPTLVDRTIRLNGIEYRVVGILPPERQDSALRRRAHRPADVCGGRDRPDGDGHRRRVRARQACCQTRSTGGAESRIVTGPHGRLRSISPR